MAGERAGGLRAVVSHSSCRDRLTACLTLGDSWWEAPKARHLSSIEARGQVLVLEQVAHDAMSRASTTIRGKEATACLLELRSEVVQKQ